MAIHLDRENQLGICYNPISNKPCSNHVIDPQTVESMDFNKVNISVNYFSSSTDYKRSREFDVDGGICALFGRLHKQGQEISHQNASYYVYNCEVVNYSVYEKLTHEKRASDKSKLPPIRYVNEVEYGAYLRVVVITTMEQTDVQLNGFKMLNAKLTDIHTSISSFTNFLRTMTNNYQYDTFRYKLLVEQSGNADAPTIKMDLSNIEDVVTTFTKNVRHSKHKSTMLHRSFCPGSVDPSVIAINRKNYAFLRGNSNQIIYSRLPNTAPMVSEMDKLLKMLEKGQIVNQSQFDYHYAKICDHHPELSSKLINFQFYDYETKYKKIKEMPLHLLLLKVLDSAKYNANTADKEEIKTTLIQLEQLCSEHCDGETEAHFRERVNKLVDYADEKLKYADNQIGDDRVSIMSNHTYVESKNMENAFLRDNDLIHNTFYSRHKIIRFLSNDKYVNTAYEFQASHVGIGALLVVLSPFALLASPYFIWQELKDLRKRRLYSTKEFLEVANISYLNNLERCMILAGDEYKDESEYIEEDVANVINYNVFLGRAKRFASAQHFFKSVKLIKRLRDLEINRFVIAVIGNTKVGKSSFLARLGLKSNAHASVHTKSLTPHMLGGVMFLDFPGNDDTDEVIRNEFLKNYRTVDMCIVVSEINKASTDGVFGLIDKLRIANDIPYMVFLNQCDRVIEDEESDDKLPVDDFLKIVDVKTDKVTKQFHHNGIKHLKILPTSFKRNLKDDLKKYGVISIRDIMFIVKQLLDKEKVQYDVSGLFEHIGGYREE